MHCLLSLHLWRLLLLASFLELLELLAAQFLGTKTFLQQQDTLLFLFLAQFCFNLFARSLQLNNANDTMKPSLVQHVSQRISHLINWLFRGILADALPAL
jgi:hypothetical protein